MPTLSAATDGTGLGLVCGDVGADGGGASCCIVCAGGCADNPGGGGGADISGVGGMAMGDVTCSDIGDVMVSGRDCVVIGATVGGGAAA